MHRFPHQLLFSLAFLFGFYLDAQILTGIVLDEKSKQPITDCIVELLGSSEMEFTDDSGRFNIDNTTHKSILRFDSEIDGYLIKDIPISGVNNFTVLLRKGISTEQGKTETLTIKTINLRKGKKIKRLAKNENPAFDILKKVWENSRTNGLKGFTTYSYEEYKKLQIDISNVDSLFFQKKAFKDFEFLSKSIGISDITDRPYLPLLINETISKVEGKNDPENIEIKTLLANKVAGIKQDQDIISTSVKSLFKEYDIYKNRIYLLEKPFISPISKDGFGSYNYQLTSKSVDIDGVDCYRIDYSPRFTMTNTFTGTIYITKDSYSVKEIEMTSPKNLGINFLNQIFISQSYKSLTKDSFVADKKYIMLDMSFNNKDDSKGFYAHSTTSYSDYAFDFPKKEDRFYVPKISSIETGLHTKSDEYWTAARHSDLSEEELLIYEQGDLITQVPRFDAAFKIIGVLSSGYVDGHLIHPKLTGIDFGSLFSLVGYNEIEGFRFRPGFRTFKTDNDMTRLSGYIGYGIKDKKVKHGLEYRHMFNTDNRFILGIGHKRDYEILVNKLITQNDIMESRNAAGSLLTIGGINKLANINRTKIYTSIEPIKNIRFGLSGTYQTIKAADSDLFNLDYGTPTRIKKDLIDTNITAFILYQPGAKHSKHGIDRFSHQKNSTPSIGLYFTKGIKGLLAADFNYRRFQLEMYYPIKLGSLGVSKVYLNLGKTFDPVPLALLHSFPANPSLVANKKSFSLLQYYEFVTDQYTTLNYTHHFDGFLISKIPLIKYSKFKLIAKVGIAYGHISPDTRALNQSNWVYLAPKTEPYFEYGFGIENIGYGNFRFLRVDFNWRGNYLNRETEINDIPKVSNFGIQIGLNMNL